MRSLDDTIAAVASPPGGAARGIVRVSGPNVSDCVARLFREHETGSLAARHNNNVELGGTSLSEAKGVASGETTPFASLRDVPPIARLNSDKLQVEPDHPRAAVGTLHISGFASPIPCDAYFWPRGRSYTGQAVAELHTLGSPSLLRAVLRSLCSAGARLAEPGEFTLRAFLAGRIDLSQAEAVLGVIDATDRRELDVALRQLAGGLARPLNELRESLLDLLSHLEAGFDFADEDIPFIGRDDLLARLEAARETIAATLDQMASRGESSDLESAVLVGRPNAGKSSLFNALATGATALVADIPGTTRDYLVAELDMDGIKCRLIDTAGRSGEWRVESGEGMEGGPIAVSHELEEAAHSLADEQKRNAAIRVFCIDSTRRPDAWETAVLEEDDDRRIVVLTKCDAGGSIELDRAVMRTSSATGEGVGQLRTELRRRLAVSRAGETDVVTDTALRCRESLENAARCVELAANEARSERDELAASEIRAALEELGRVVGAVYTDDVLDRIFSRFCVGK